MTAMTQFVDCGGVAIHVRVSGPPGAPAVLLAHALGASLEIWEPQAEALATSFRVIRFDLRGHGLSELGSGRVSIEQFADDALAVLDALGVASAHVGGISIGGLVAQAIAVRAPERVRSLILVDTARAFPPPERWRDRAATVRARGVAAIADDTLGRWVSPEYLATAAGRGLRSILLATSSEGFAAAAEALAVADYSAAKLAGPALVLVGEHDVGAPPSVSAALAASIPGARLVVVPGARHVPLGEHAAEVTAAIAAHLAAQRDDGATVRAEVLGADHVARATNAITELDRDFQAYLTRAAWGEVWARPHFDRRTRSIVTLALLAAGGHDEEFALHVRAMRNTGATPADLAELLLHVAVYAGVPAANAAMRVAKRVLAE